MKLLIVHLSDLHIKNTFSLLQEQAQKIIDGIKNLETGVIKVFFVFTGDISFSGKAEEYLLAADFLDTLRSEAKLKICKDVQLIIVPGNHDCLFTENDEDARNTILKSLKENKYKVAGPSILSICLKNQENFQDYCFNIYCEKPNVNIENIFYQYSCSVNEFIVSFNCLNTAWCSILDETAQYGELGFPIDFVKENLSSDFIISIMHHPLNWFDPSNSKLLKKVLNENSDLILTGHEHEPDQTDQYNFKGKKHTEYIEGGVLFDNEPPSESSFNVIFLDIDKRKQKIYQLNLKDKLYQYEEIYPGWLSIQQSSKKNLNRFKLTDHQEKWLADPGATLYYQYDEESITLDDIFVFPEMKDTYIDESNINLNDKINSEILLKVDPLSNRCMIVGAEAIGKTILLKKLYTEFYEKGYVPVFIEGRDIKETSPDSFRKLLLRNVRIQYQHSKIAEIEQIDPNSFFVLIDNFHHVDLSLKFKARFLDNNFIEKEGRKIYPNVIICGNDYLQFEDLIFKDDTFINPLLFFKNFRILPFGINMRYKLIEKWYRIKKRRLEEREIIFKIDQAEQLINSNIGNDFFPKYPLFILVHLHKIDLERETELKTSSYGFYYEYLIMTTLGRKNTELLDSYLTYLTQLAYFMYDKKCLDITGAEFKKFDRDIFRIKYRFSEDYSIIVKYLVSTGILDNNNDVFAFKYNYIYYYFIARYFRETISSELTKSELVKIVKHLYKDENANIIIFLTHLSKDTFILETVLNSSKEIFQEFPPLEINNDCNAIDSLIATLPKLVVENENIKANREKIRKNVEKTESITTKPTYNSAKESESSSNNITEEPTETEKMLMNSIRLAVKTLQVLGQIAKNYHGSLTITQLHDVVEESYMLGLRTANSFIVLLENNTNAVVELITERLSEIITKKNSELSDDKKIELSDDKKRDMAKILTFNLCVMVVGSMLKRISYAVGTEMLNDTYADLFEQYTWNSIKLIDISIKLDQYQNFPMKEIIEANKYLKKKKLSDIILKIFVKFYLEMYPVGIETLQKISAELGLEMKTLRLLTYKQTQSDQ
jgi:hypothetical protein